MSLGPVNSDQSPQVSRLHTNLRVGNIAPPNKSQASCPTTCRQSQPSCPTTFRQSPQGHGIKGVPLPGWRTPHLERQVVKNVRSGVVQDIVGSRADGSLHPPRA